jgi:isocitrate dehydrogenase
VGGLGMAPGANIGDNAAIANKEVTYDLARLMEPRVEPVSCSGFAEAVIKHFEG